MSHRAQVFGISLFVCASLLGCSPNEPITDDTSQQHPPSLDLQATKEAIVEHAGATDDTQVGDAEDLLPDMFEGDANTDKVRMSGKLLTDEEATQLQNRVDGAEVKIEISTK